ncbi:T9SS type A sorting domain-containing protein [candidate division KSB1 bacterium]|nr:T9SS type A sorting domain-containing protein [candidate division KSB1 bacterium]
MDKFSKLVMILFLLAFSVPVFCQNLVVGGNMEDESAWNITYFTTPEESIYEFNYTQVTPKFGRGGCLYVYQGEASGQLLLWQRIKLIAGKTYRATGAIAALDYMGGPEGGGAWYQMYIDPSEVDESATDYNPGAIKFFNMDGWQEEFPEIFDDLWEVVNLGGGVDSAPYYTPEGTPGEEVEVTFGIKFGQYWSDYSGTTYELLVDEVGLFPVESAINAGGNMEDESDWNVSYFTDPPEPVYDFNFTAATPKFGHGGCLDIVQGEAFGQLLLWQRIKLIAGQTYRATAAIAALDYMGGPEGGGAWYQMYIDPLEVDETASDYNPGEIKFFNMDGWQEDFPEIFDNLWESESLGGGVDSAPYYTAEGTPGEEVEVTFGIKFGQYWADYAGTFYELLVDDVYLFPMTKAGMTTSVASKTALPTRSDLVQNYPNPFNPTTNITYHLVQPGPVELTVYDLLGHKVATLVDRIQQAGSYSVQFDASGLGSGVYVYKLTTGSHVYTQKMMLIK